jgi:hypothetical protein
MCAFAVPVSAQPKGKADKGAGATAPPASDKGPKSEGAKESKSGGKDGKDKVKNFDFNAMDLNGRMRTPQLLYFLERANEELERASLEKRSFVPHMVKSVEEESL